MALSPQYSWPEPDNSSLVKNGAQDIRALGDAIDTSVWNIGYGQAGKNKFINGDFGIWQRGTTITDPAGGSFLADRFKITYDGTAPTSRTYSQQTFALGTAPVAGYEGKFFARVAVTTKGSNTRAGLLQPIESVRTFAGQTATISFYAKCDTARAGSILVTQFFGNGGSPSASVTVIDSAVSYTSSWARYTLTVAIPSISGKTLGTDGTDGLQIAFFHTSADGSTFDIWGVQLEYGSKATPFQTASGGSPQAELAMCQRYYWRATVDGVGDRFGYGSNISTTDAQIMTQYPVQMRTIPTALETSGTAGDYSVVEPGSVTPVCTAVPTFLNATNWSALTTFLTGGTLTQFRPSAGRAAAATAYLGWSAEL